MSTIAPAPAATQNTRSTPWLGASTATLTLALASGGIFGFLIQKGGAAQFDILIGALLLENFVVVKIMLSAILVGMVGSHFLERRGWLERQIGETVVGRVLEGGLIFGAGFALLAYCPGTDAAPIGQGNLDALVGALGLLFGSFLFALRPSLREHRALSWGRLGEVTLPDVLHVDRQVFVLWASAALLAALLLLERLDPAP